MVRWRWLGLVLWGACAQDSLSLPEAATQENDKFACYAKDIGSLRDCVSRLQKQEVSAIVFTALIQNDDGSAPVSLKGLSKVTLKGDRPLDRNNPRGLRAKDDQKKPLVELSEGQDLRVENLLLEGALPPGSREVCQGCDPLLTATSIEGLRLENVHVIKSRSDGIRFLRSKNVEFRNSTVSDAGEFGLRAGYDEPENHVRGLKVVDSTFKNVRVNALWLSVSPVAGNEDNQVENTTFENCHWHGIYPVLGKSERYDGGAIVVAPGSSSIRISRNRIQKTYCDVCTSKRSHGIEVNRSANVLVADNVMKELNGFPIYANPGSSLSNFVVRNNDFRNNRSKDFNRAANVRESGGRLENNRSK